MKAQKEIEGNIIEIIFDYKESCHHIYKTFNIYKNDKKSNIKILKKYFDKLPFYFITNFYFFSPGRNSNERRFREGRALKQIKEWFEENNFTIVN